MTLSQGKDIIKAWGIRCSRFLESETCCENTLLMEMSQLHTIHLRKIVIT